MPATAAGSALGRQQSTHDHWRLHGSPAAHTVLGPHGQTREPRCRPAQGHRAAQPRNEAAAERTLRTRCICHGDACASVQRLAGEPYTGASAPLRGHLPAMWLAALEVPRSVGDESVAVGPWRAQRLAKDGVDTYKCRLRRWRQREIDR
jgi:hypothetical protein